MAYVIVAGANPALPGLNETNTMTQILYWIGFTSNVQRTNIMADSMNSFDDVRFLAEKDINSMASEYSSRTQLEGKIHFGIRRTKLLKALVHWIQDFYRVSETPNIDGLTQDTFKDALQIALARADIRKSIKDNTSSNADAASPGPLESERKWKQWEEKFLNYTRSHLGANGIPLSYVIRENDAPNIGGTFPDFISQTIECAPLSGEFYNADKMNVFHMIVSFTTGQPSGDWIKSTLRYADGRRSMKALRDHFAGEGNATRNMAEADRLKDNLHYKSERAMPFETFLTNCQKMFNIYEKEGEAMTDEAKTRFLLKKVQHTGLRGAIEALKAQQTAGTAVTYTMAANHLSTAVSELPEYISKSARNVSLVDATPGQKGSPEIYNDDGTIKTGHIPTWRQLSKADRAIVMAERLRLGIKGGKNGNSKGGSNSTKNDANRMKQLSDQNKKYRRQIKAMKRKSKDDDTNGSDKESDDDKDDDAGDQFGGKASRKKKRSKT